MPAATKSSAKKKPAKAARSLQEPGAIGARVVYLYAISREGSFRIATPGVDGASAVTPLACSGLICWTSEVPRRDFADELDERMQNLDWIAAAGVRHQQVVAAIAAETDVLPARFATVFLSADSLQRHVRAQKPVLLAAFDRVAGCEEWGLKVYSVASAAPAPKADAASGREYLQQKAASLQFGARRRDPEIESLAAELGQHSKEWRTTAPQTQPGVEWQASFLVPRKKRDRFLQVTANYAEQWRDRHRIECTGPWPSYSFVGSLAGDSGESAATRERAVRKAQPPKGSR